MKRRNRNPRKGMSIMEVVITIAVFSIITTASISLITHSIRIEKTIAQNAEIALYAENALECYRFAEDKDAFFTLLKKTGDFVDADGDGVVADNEKIILEKDAYTIEIKLDLVYNNRIEIVAKSESGSILYSVDYGKV